jgi:hypothetical protein
MKGFGTVGLDLFWLSIIQPGAGRKKSKDETDLFEITGGKN